MSNTFKTNVWQKVRDGREISDPKERELANKLKGYSNNAIPADKDRGHINSDQKEFVNGVKRLRRNGEVYYMKSGQRHGNNRELIAYNKVAERKSDRRKGKKLVQKDLELGLNHVD